MGQAGDASFADLVRAYRREVGWRRGTPLSAETLALEIHVAPNTLRGYEADKPASGPRLDTVEALATFFAAELEWDAQTRAAFVAAGKARMRRRRARAEDQSRVVIDAEGAARRGHGWVGRRRRWAMGAGGILVGLAVAAGLAARILTPAPSVWAPWSGYHGALGVATCGPPRCVGYEARLTYTFQYKNNDGYQLVYGRGDPHRQLQCMITPATVPHAIPRCDHDNLTNAHKAVYMIYRVKVGGRWLTRWLRLDVWYDGHTDTYMGDGPNLGGPHERREIAPGT